MVASEGPWRAAMRRKRQGPIEHASSARCSNPALQTEMCKGPAARSPYTFGGE